jgi:hypothetical protein
MFSAIYWGNQGKFFSRAQNWWPPNPLNAKRLKPSPFKPIPNLPIFAA